MRHPSDCSSIFHILTRMTSSRPGGGTRGPRIAGENSRLFAGQTPALLEQIRNAIARDDCQLLERAAHTLKALRAALAQHLRAKQRRHSNAWAAKAICPVLRSVRLLEQAVRLAHELLAEFEDGVAV
jgi:HPt (histidine-containing phosphotransfer) domain-containing protein